MNREIRIRISGGIVSPERENEARADVAAWLDRVESWARSHPPTGCTVRLETAVIGTRLMIDDNDDIRGAA